MGSLTGKSAPGGAAVTERHVTAATSAPHSLARYAPYALAAFFMVWGLRGATSSDIVLTDAARHAMNGAYVHDLLRQGLLTAPVEFGKDYYSRLPALSLPYHPPLFPIFESLFFSVMGVNVLAARLAVATAVAGCVLLFYRLVLATHGSNLLAVCATVTFFSLRLAQWVANDVMLEFPALTFVLAALYCLRGLDREYPLRRGVTFSLLAGAAVWTKQQTVFLGLVPFFYIIISRRWRLLADKTLWLSSVLFALLVISLMTLSMMFNWAGIDQVTRGNGVVAVFFRNLGIYITSFRQWFGAIPAVLVGVVFLLLLFAPGRRRPATASGNDLYLAWIGSSFLVLLLMDAYEDRYLFFLCPAFVVIAYAAVFHFCRWVLPPAHAWYLPLGVAASALIFNLNASAAFMHGPAEVAKTIIKPGNVRVLYCGRTNGSFIFAVRSLDPQLRTLVIRGDKLPANVFTPSELESFAHRYGINYIVLERTTITPKGWTTPWDQLRASPAPSMILEREVPLVSSDPEFIGDLRVYRFNNPSENPEHSLSIFVQKIGGEFEVKLKN